MPDKIVDNQKITKDESRMIGFLQTVAILSGSFPCAGRFFVSPGAWRYIRFLAKEAPRFDSAMVGLLAHHLCY